MIRESSVILENRVREVIGGHRDVVGTALMENASGPRNDLLRFSAFDEEQCGVMEIYRGIIAFLRNTSGHYVIDTYSQSDALRSVA